MRAPAGGQQSLTGRLLSGALVILAAAVAVYVAVKLLLAVLWFLLGMGGAVLLIALAWVLWQRKQRGW
jgi:hypothetical protein